MGSFVLFNNYIDG